MSGNHNSGRKPKYLTVERWDLWLNNHWKHMSWKVNGLLAGFVIITGMLITILCAILALVYKG